MHHIQIGWSYIYFSSCYTIFSFATQYGITYGNDKIFSQQSFSIGRNLNMFIFFSFFGSVYKAY